MPPAPRRPDTTRRRRAYAVESLRKNRTRTREAQMNSSAVRWGNTLFEMAGKKAWSGCALAYCWHMNWKAHCAAVIPCLNEAAIIENVVTAARDYLPNVFIVD